MYRLIEAPNRALNPHTFFLKVHPTHTRVSICIPRASAYPVHHHRVLLCNNLAIILILITSQSYSFAGIIVDPLQNMDPCRKGVSPQIFHTASDGNWVGPGNEAKKTNIHYIKKLGYFVHICRLLQLHQSDMYHYQKSQECF